jgi:ABC-type transport system involved in cytochrome c biogenesis permease subunit
MGKLVSFFIAGPTAPARLQLLLIAAAAVAIACMSLLIWGLYWRGEYREAKAAVTALAAQGQVLADKVETCSAAATETKRVGDAAIAAMGGLVAEAKKVHKDRTTTAQSLEEIARRTRTAGEGCDWAWQQIEQQKRKARAAP